MTSDLQAARSGLQSIGAVLGQQSTLASNLPVPASFATQKQTVLSAVAQATTDDTTAVGSATLDSMSAESAKLGTDLGSVSAQITSLVTAMK